MINYTRPARTTTTTPAPAPAPTINYRHTGRRHAAADPLNMQPGDVVSLGRVAPAAPAATR